MKRLRSVAWGLGAVALGGVAATSVAVVVESGFAQQAHDWVKDLFDGQEPSPVPADEAPLQTEGDTGSDGESSDQEAPEAPMFDPNFSIDSGEGGIAFFQSLGLNESQWYEIAGELRSNFPNEFYTDGYDVRIQNSGQLSIEAQQFIKNRFGL